jgi:hypothetical protein
MNQASTASVPHAHDRDEEHLRLLATFHYVLAGIAALFALFPIVHFVIGTAMVASASRRGQGVSLEQWMGWFFVLMSILMIVGGLAFAACLAIAGRCIAHRRRYTFCLVMAGIACLFFPVGTVLGVFTIVVLTRDSVRSLFGASKAV